MASAPAGSRSAIRSPSAAISTCRRNGALSPISASAIRPSRPTSRNWSGAAGSIAGRLASSFCAGEPMVLDLPAMTGSLLGGIGLFLLGMWLMTDGLKHAAGDALHDILQTGTSTPLRGLAAGFAVTAMVQSSTAITVATIGFVNAGLLNLVQAIWVIFGANIGATMTGWLAAVIGLKLKIELFAMPLI